MDVLEHLTQEHREVEQLLSRLSEADEGARAGLIDELERALTVHMAVEEQHVYPIVERVIDRETEEEAETEHDLAREGIAKLRELCDAPGFGAAVDMLAAGIKHHVEEEEQEVFPELREKAADELAAMDAEQLESELGSGEPGGRRRRSSSPSDGGGSGATKEELYQQAKDAGIEGRSTMSKDELEAALAER